MATLWAGQPWPAEQGQLAGTAEARSRDSTSETAVKGLASGGSWQKKPTNRVAAGFAFGMLAPQVQALRSVLPRFINGEACLLSGPLFTARLGKLAHLPCVAVTLMILACASAQPQLYLP